MRFGAANGLGTPGVVANSTRPVLELRRVCAWTAACRALAGKCSVFLAEVVSAFAGGAVEILRRRIRDAESFYLGLYGGPESAGMLE